MIAEAKAFWEAISGKVKSLIQKETENAMRLQRYDVTTAPNGTVMGVRQPFGNNEIFLPYSQEVSTATVGDTVLVAWWGSMSNAKVYYFADGYDGGGTVTSVNGQTGDVTVREPGTWVGLTKTYTANSYVSETQFNRIQVYSNGEIVIMVINLQVGSSPGSTFRAIGNINLPRNLWDSFSITLASQSGNATLLMSVSASGRIEIYNGYGTATGWYRATAVMPLSGI